MQRVNQPGDIHFVTFTTYKKYPIFKHEQCCRLFLDNLNFYRDKYNLRIYGYVIMPDHLHLLLDFDMEKFPELTISKVMQQIKGASARQIIDHFKYKGVEQRLYASQRGWRKNLSYLQPDPRKFLYDQGVEQGLSATQKGWKKKLPSLDPGTREPLLLKERTSLPGTREPLLSGSEKETNYNHKRGLKYKIWHRSFYDFNIYTPHKFWQKLEYIHNNPIKHGLVSSLADFKYSSWKNYEFEDHSLFQTDYPIY